MKRIAASIVRLACFAALVPAVAVSASAATTRPVCPAGCAYTSIQSAIVAATAGDTVLVYPGTYAEQLDFLGKAITVRSDGGAGVTTVDAQKKNSVVRFVTGEGAGSILQGFTLTNGQSATGGGVYVSAASPIIRDCVITANQGTVGGGVRVVSGTATLEGCSVTGNHSSTGGGGASAASSTLVLTNSEVSGNHADQDGGGIYASTSTLTLGDSVVSGNEADWGGGGVYAYGGTLTLSGATVSGNHAVQAGGGLIATLGNSLSSTQSVISGNSSESYGGGLFAHLSTVNLTDSTLQGNAATLSGGGASIDGPSSSTTLLRSSVLGNSAGMDGGGLMVSSGSLSLGDCRVSSNNAGQDGGGLYISSAAATALVSTEFTGNVATTGGGINSSGTTVTLNRCRLAGNSVTSVGGAAAIVSNSIWSVTNTQVDGNQATGNGGGFWINGAAVGMKYVTLAGNRSFAFGGAANIASGNLTATSCIVWGNFASSGGNAFSPAVQTATYSDIQGGHAGTGNINLDPLFVGQLPVNNAPTAAGDYRLLPVSPCIDQALADSSTPLTDRDGDPRPQGPAPDMGADESALLRNGAFDVVSSGKRPLSWSSSKLTTADGLVAPGYTGPFAMAVKGGAGTKRLSQTADYDGAAGQVISLTFRHRAKKPARTGGYLGIKVTLTNNDGSSTVFLAPVARTTHGWQGFSDTYLVPKGFNKVTVSLVSSAMAGWAWFDDVAVAVR